MGIVGGGDARDGGDVEVWLADVDAFWVAHGPALTEVLADDERECAERFRFARDRQRFVARRGLRRVVLGRACGVDAAVLRFVEGTHGKPRLRGRPEVDFSASHSAGLAAFVVARGTQVGIDVERLRDDVDVDGLARRYFAPEEVEALSALRGAERRRAFFACWTAKEAFVKAIGRGLSYPLDAFAVSFSGPPAIAIADEPDASARWTLHSLDAGPDHAGALVVDGARSVARPRRLDPARFAAWPATTAARTAAPPS